MSASLLVEYFEEFQGTQKLEQFIRRVRRRYTTGTLERLLGCAAEQNRRAAIFALGFIGTMNSNTRLAACLHDSSVAVREAAHNALWNVWFRGDIPSNNRELARLARLIKTEEYGSALAGLDDLISRAPRFAEAYNQRAILYFRWADYDKAVRDCRQAIELNPIHFGAWAGLAQCHVRRRQHLEALNAFRSALVIHPHMPGVRENVRSLEIVLDKSPSSNPQSGFIRLSSPGESGPVRGRLL